MSAKGKKGRGSDKETVKQMIEETSVKIIGGFRVVTPFMFTYNTKAKPRMTGPLISIMLSEFPSRDSVYYGKAIEDGRVKVDGCHVDASFEVQQGATISHTLHRHEPPVSDAAIVTLHSSDKFVIVDKPSGIPVHPSGRFHHNTVVNLLAREHNAPRFLIPCHRIDRGTSGILVLGRTGADCATFHSCAKQKVYLALVHGQWRHANGFVIDQPLVVASKKKRRGKVRVATTEEELCGAKSAQTRVDCVWVSAGRSLLRCEIFTGRTHQIRVHLSYLGFPIECDPLYGESSDIIGGTAVPEVPLADRDPNCPECTRVFPASRPPMKLHSSRYICEGLFDITAPDPEWAKYYE